MTTTPTTIEELLDYWPGNIPFKGKLVSEDGSCMCAQGQVLHFLGGLTVDQLQKVGQPEADDRVAKLLGISRAHSVLLRRINDTQEGAPTCVIRNPEQVLGGQAQVVLALWWHFDRMTPADWTAVKGAVNEVLGGVAWVAARDVAHEAACAAVGEAACEEACAAVGVTAWQGESTYKTARVTMGATNEIQGAAVMRARNQPFFFLPLLGFADPEAVMLLDAAGVEVGP